MPDETIPQPEQPTPEPTVVIDEAAAIPPEVIAAVAEVAAAPLPPDETIQKAIDEAGEPLPRPVFTRIGAQSWVEEIDQETGAIVRRYPQPGAE